MVGRADYYEEGGWNAVCYECGRKRKASQLKRHWQGYYVCPEHWEARQPQDFVRSVPDVQTPPWAQPMPADNFRQYCYSWARQGIAGLGSAGCAIAGLDLGEIYGYCTLEEIEPYADFATADCARVLDTPVSVTI